ncbi:DMT family transporter [Weissella fangxianensis]|uniref:DMT family transporter n=1 Tax=Weissella fangxianensis TaxID=2953879 RepID=UPI0021579538|nr:DMT family transporter [Weissella fangxianensis]
MVLIYLGVAFLAGFLLANQNPINSDLSKIVRSPFLAASISFLVGTLFLGLLSWGMTGDLWPSKQFISNQPMWIWLGGLLGGIYLTSNVVLFPKLGAMQTVILPILGQILMGTIIDTFGWFQADLIPLTGLRFIGLIILTLGVICAVVLPSKLNNSEVILDNTRKNNAKLFWQIWAIIAGAVSAIQQAINGHLGTILNNSEQAAFISFFTGFLLIMVFSLIVERRLPKISELKTTKVWNWFGGILGGSFVLATVLTVPQIGAGLTITMSLIGSITGSMLVQQFGWWRSVKSSISFVQILGVIIMAVGVVIIKFL